MPTNPPLPRQVAELVERLGLAGHVTAWRTITDGRSDQARTRVVLLGLDVAPERVVVKVSGSGMRSRHAIANERAALSLLQQLAIVGRLPVPQVLRGSQTGEGELVLEFLPGERLDSLVGRPFEPRLLAEDLAHACREIWRIPLSVGPLVDQGTSASHRIRSRLARLDGVLDPDLQVHLEAWAAPHLKTRRSDPTGSCLTHGDLRPANLLVHMVDDTIRLSGVIDFAKASGAVPADDLALLLETIAPVHRELPALLRAQLPEVDDASLHEARVLLCCDLLDGAARIRDWEAFARFSSDLDRLL